MWLSNSPEIGLMRPICITVTGTKKRRFKLSIAEEREVMKGIRSNIPISAIAHLFDVSVSTIYRTRRRLSETN